MTKHYTTTWAHMPKPRRAHRDWRNVTLAFVFLCILAVVPSFAMHMVEVTQYDRENSFKVGEME